MVLVPRSSGFGLVTSSDSAEPDFSSVTSSGRFRRNSGFGSVKSSGCAELSFSSVKSSGSGAHLVDAAALLAGADGTQLGSAKSSGSDESLDLGSVEVLVPWNSGFGFRQGSGSAEPPKSAVEPKSSGSSEPAIFVILL